MSIRVSIVGISLHNFYLNVVAYTKFYIRLDEFILKNCRISMNQFSTLSSSSLPYSFRSFTPGLTVYLSLRKAWRICVDSSFDCLYVCLQFLLHVVLTVYANYANDRWERRRRWEGKGWDRGQGGVKLCCWKAASRGTWMWKVASSKGRGPNLCFIAYLPSRHSYLTSQFIIS